MTVVRAVLLIAIAMLVSLGAELSATPLFDPLPPDDARAHVDVIMVTQSPAEAIEDAIKYNPDIAAALKNNSTQLYLLKNVSYTNGTAEDLDLPKEHLLPNGAPDRVRVADKVVYSSPVNYSNLAPGEETEQTTGTAGVYAKLQLVPIPIN